MLSESICAPTRFCTERFKEHRMGVTCVAVVGLVWLWASPATAASFEDLEGKSIVYAYHERRIFPNGNTVNAQWTGKIYVAPDGRVFFRHHGAAHFGVNGSEFQQTTFDTEGDRDGHGNGQRTNYHWNGNGFSRDWTEKGVRITQTVSVEGGRCSAFIEREPDPGMTQDHSGSCRIVSGNALR